MNDTMAKHILTMWLLNHDTIDVKAGFLSLQRFILHGYGCQLVNINIRNAIIIKDNDYPKLEQ